ncbi:MAG: long-chain fatty aldehyde decarbonylase, partial [Saprospiraceae bacterium]
NYARKEGLNIHINMESPYWGSVRQHFLAYADKKDFIACLIIQEVMLESFAVSMYTDVGHGLGGEAGRLFLSIAEEEKGHLEHSSDFLRAALREDPDGFIRKFEEIHFKCMTIMAEFSATTDLRGHCGVCNGSCMKGSLHHVGLDMISMRGHAMALYAESLDNIGIPGEKSMLWIARLPA